MLTLGRWATVGDIESSRGCLRPRFEVFEVVGWQIEQSVWLVPGPHSGAVLLASMCADEMLVCCGCL